MTSPQTPDVRLIERIAGGDRDAHEQFRARHHLSLYAQVYAILVDAAAAERVVVETFELAWRAAQHFNPGAGGAFAWLSDIVRSLARRRHRPLQDPVTSPSLAR